MLKVFAGVLWLLVGWLCVAVLFALLSLAFMIDELLKSLSRFCDWLLVACLRCW